MDGQSGWTATRARALLRRLTSAIFQTMLFSITSLRKLLLSGAKRHHASIRTAANTLWHCLWTHN